MIKLTNRFINSLNALLLISLAFSTQALATQNKSVTDTHDDIVLLQNLLRQAKGLSAQVNQSSYKYYSNISTKDILQQTDALLYLEYPLKFNWQVTGNFPQQIISDGITSWYYEADIQQVIIQPVSQQDLAQTPILLLSSSAEQIANTFEVTSETNGAIISFKLLSKNISSIFKELNLIFNNEIISKLLLFDNMSNATEFIFSKVKLLDITKPEMFIFEIPPGVEIVQQ